MMIACVDNESIYRDLSLNILWKNKDEDVVSLNMIFAWYVIYVVRVFM